MVKDKTIENIIKGKTHQSAISTFLLVWFYRSFTVVKVGWGYNGMING